MTRKYLILFFSIILSICLFNTQSFGKNPTKKSIHLPFTKTKNQYNFAQMYLGYELTSYNISSPDLYINTDKSTLGHNLTFGGWHFWGLMDFYVSIPFIKQKLKFSDGEHEFAPNIETVARWYPIRLSSNSIRPFLGAGFAAFSYEGANNAPKSYYINYPLSAGVSFANINFQWDLGVKRLSPNKFDYSFSENQKNNLQFSENLYFISLKRIADTTLMYQSIKKIQQPSGFYPYWGIGPSYAWITSDKKQNSYFTNNSPNIDNSVSLNFLPELSFGAHWKYGKGYSNRMLLQIVWRKLDYKLQAFDKDYSMEYNSLSTEIAHTLFDYHGFVPFIGLSYNSATMKMSGYGYKKQTTNINGFLFGWDLLPTGAKSNWTLRTNIRWYPKVSMEIEKDNWVSFPNTEFNIVQWVYQFNK